jgi:hypothetical protein
MVVRVAQLGVYCLPEGLCDEWRDGKGDIERFESLTSTFAQVSNAVKGARNVSRKLGALLLKSDPGHGARLMTTQRRQIAEVGGEN